MNSEFVLVWVLIVGAGAGCMKDEGTDQVDPPDASTGDPGDAVSERNDPDRPNDVGQVGNDSRDNGGGSDLDAAQDGAWDADASVVDAGSTDPPADRLEASDMAVEELPTDLANGQACRSGSWCHSHFCVDGVCCDGACEQDEAMRCRACTMARTGQRDGICAADHGQEHAPCGAACRQVGLGVPSVVEMVCVQGKCVLPDAPRIVDTCRRELDHCATSFCDQATPRSARCVFRLCPMAGACCCENPADVTARSCVATNSCHAGGACVSQ